ncbi:zinc ribbon domain-containing protein [Micromonospora carbonacea]|uniref:zinc ribbon domain-containing protein n=1 Tax=Micromonospora carbonacea TaxID=47853 RepID=UPI003710827C
MRTCDNCGAEVTPGDGFCGNCGAFLAWNDPAPPPAPAATAVGAPAARDTATDAARDAGAGDAGAGDAGAGDAGAGAGAGESVAGDTAGPGADTAAEPGTAAEDTAARRAAALVVPVRPVDDDGPDRSDPVPAAAPAEPPPAADQPRAVRPGLPVAPGPVVRDFAGDAAGAPDDVVCPACGTGNPAGRSFCRRCGGPLAAPAGPAAAVPWWRRLRWPRRRPGRGGLRRLLAVLLVLALLAAAAWAAVRFGPRAVDAVRDRTTTPEAVLPSAVVASSEARGHPARSLVDGLNNRYWAPAADRPATGQYVELTFDPPIRLMDLIVHTGASPQQDVFVRQARPAELTLTLWTGDGPSSTRQLRLSDRPGPQTFHHVVGGVTRLRLTIDASYGAQRGREVALAEVEVFRRP